MMRTDVPELRDATVWITGASSGIGEALARACAARGSRLILSARRRERLENLCRSLPRSDEHRVVPLDLADADSLSGIARQVLADAGAIDVLINNGGIAQRGFALETELPVDRQIMDVNFFGTVALTKAVAPAMVARGKGAIVTISSIAGKVGSQQRSTYSASKHALLGFMDCLRAELWRHGIHVLVACPGWVKTDISLNALNARGEKENRMDSTIAAGIPADDCAEQVLRALERGRDEVIIGRGLSYWAPTIKKYLPGLFNRMIRRKVHR